MSSNNQSIAQSESQLEADLISRLIANGYEYVRLKDRAAMYENIRVQLEKLNKEELRRRGGETLTMAEVRRLFAGFKNLDHYGKAAVLRQRINLVRDSGETVAIRLFDTERWCSNHFQVANQIDAVGEKRNRYDVTLLCNGLPLTQIELKKRGQPLDEAFVQIERYYKDSYTSALDGLFEFVQVFVISNGVNTKYFANNGQLGLNFKQTFFWTNEQNERYSALLSYIDNKPDFTQTFLDKCHLSMMIARYMVLHQTSRQIMIMRPYQVYAVEAIIDRVLGRDDGGYTWHTTGSGKTLTSFKTSQLLIELPNVAKVIFVVDRRDLDQQTTEEFNKFDEGCVENTTNTGKLVGQMADKSRKLIVTTIQKLSRAVKKPSANIEYLRDEKVVLIFDECHRSQFGETHQNIKHFFRKAQLFGFTGTPIFTENSNEGYTTQSIFGECLHKYLIHHAIADQNVLPFAVDTVNLKVVERGVIYESLPGGETNAVIGITSQARVDAIARHIHDIHDVKTINRRFNAMLSVESQELLKVYYQTFKRMRDEGTSNLRVATIFSYLKNENQDETSVLMDGENRALDPSELSSQAFLESCIQDYNAMYGVRFSCKDSRSFNAYYADIAKRTKDGEVDILLVINMFTTGYDAKGLNTLYLDKQVKHHGLIQTFSRTNRILDGFKTVGNVISFRPLKDEMDAALRLYSDGNADATGVFESKDSLIIELEEALDALKVLAPTPSDFDSLISEQDQAEFTKAFSKILRIKNKLRFYPDAFNEAVENHGSTTQEIADFQSKYLDLKRKVDLAQTEDGDDTHDPVIYDFVIDNVSQELINTDYILGLIKKASLNPGDESPEFSHERIRSLLHSSENFAHNADLFEDFAQYARQQKIRTEEEFDQLATKYFSKRCASELNCDAKDVGVKLGTYVKAGSARTQDGHRILKTEVQPPLGYESRRDLFDKIKTGFDVTKRRFANLPLVGALMRSFYRGDSSSDVIQEIEAIDTSGISSLEVM